MAVIGNNIDCEEKRQWVEESSEYRVYYVPEIEVDNKLVQTADKCITKEDALKKAAEARDNIKKANSIRRLFWKRNKKRIIAISILVVILLINWSGTYQSLKLLHKYLLGQIVLETTDLSWIIPSVVASVLSYLLWKLTKIKFEFETKKYLKEQQSEFILAIIKLGHLKNSLGIKLYEDVVVFDNSIEKDILLSKEIELIITQHIIKYLDTFELFDMYLNNFMSQINCLEVYFECEKRSRDGKPKLNIESEDLGKFQDIINRLNEIASDLESFLNTEYERIYKRSIFSETIK